MNHDDVRAVTVPVVLLACLTLLSHQAMGQARVEMTSDGRWVGLCDAEQGDGCGEMPQMRDSTPIFSLTPDWNNDIRRPVSAVRVADVNGDGHMDLVAACFQANSSTPYPDYENLIYFGTGSGLAAQPGWVSTDEVHSSDLAIRDLNGDGYVDIFCANGGFAHAPSVIYWGSARGPSNSPGWFSSTPQSTWALAVTVIDFDHDGDLDVVTSNQSGITGDNFRPLYMFRSNVSTGGTLPNTTAWQSTDAMIANGIAAGDVDGDTWEDLAVAKWVNFQSAVYKNNNGTPSSLPEWTSGDASGARGAAIGDIDGDNLPDLVFGYDSARMYRNLGDGTFAQVWQAAPPFAGLQELLLVDVDGDKDLDVVETHFSDGRTHVYLNTGGTLATTPSWSFDALQVSNAVDVGDVNGDGCVDLVVGYSGDISLRAFYGKCQPAPCSGDIVPPGGDGTVNVNDLLAVINNWGACADPNNCPPDIAPPGGDDVVHVNDLLAVINAWGACP